MSAVPDRSLRKRFVRNRILRSLWANKKARFGLILVGFFALIALFGPLIVGDPTAFDALPYSPPNGDLLLGSTGQGQDVFAQTVIGARQTLWVAVVTGLGVVLLGAIVGGLAGYLGGWIDEVLSALINVFLVIPGLPLMVILAAWMPPGPSTMIAVLILSGWAWNARVLRSQVLGIRHRDFVNASIVSGEPALQVLFRDILPNMLSLLMTCLIGATVYAIGAQVGLEFIGLGDPSAVTWGTNLYWARNDSALLMGAWWTFVPTGVAIALVGFGLTLLNFGIDEITNPRLTKRPKKSTKGGPK
jgi:peptide/nickel transport system permease protein